MRQALHADAMPSGAIYFRQVDPALFGNIVASFHGGPHDPADLVAGATASAAPSPAIAGPARPD